MLKKIDIWNIDSLVYVQHRAKLNFFFSCYIFKSVPNRDFSLMSRYKVHTYWTHLGYWLKKYI